MGNLQQIVSEAKLVDARDRDSRYCGFDSHQTPHILGAMVPR